MEQAVPFHAHHTRQWVQHIGDKLNRICAVMDCAWNHRLRIEKQCCGLCLQWSPFPSPAPNDHTEIRCFDNHRQSKRCVRNPKLRTMVGPANPVPWGAISDVHHLWGASHIGYLWDICGAQAIFGSCAIHPAVNQT